MFIVKVYRIKVVNHLLKYHEIKINLCKLYNNVRKFETIEQR